MLSVSVQLALSIRVTSLSLEFVVVLILYRRSLRVKQQCHCRGPRRGQAHLYRR